jgi:hypothetical protein
LRLNGCHRDLNFMSTQPQVETVATGADKAKLAGAVLLLLAGIVAFYYLGKQDLWLRVLALLALLALPWRCSSPPNRASNSSPSDAIRCAK